jgi:4-hydroxy-3-polyprenylbenzoate decarboxylase
LPGSTAGKGIHLAKCKTVDLEVPAESELVLEGTITPGERHRWPRRRSHRLLRPRARTGSRCSGSTALTHRKNPVYMTTFSGRPPKEDAMMAIALNRIYNPILRQQVPEIQDFFLPMEGLSYKAAILSIDKAYPGQARGAAFAFWSALPQFSYTKFVIVVDKAINIRDPRQVMWAVTSKVDPARDVFILPEQPLRSPRLCHRQSRGWAAVWALMPPPRCIPKPTAPGMMNSNPDPDTAALVDKRWAEYGLDDINLTDVDPNLFGYDL